MKIPSLVTFLLFTSAVHAYDTVSQFPPERFCLRQTEKIQCDSTAEMHGLRMTGYAACDQRALVRRVADGREFLILFTGDGVYHRMGPGVGTLSSISMAISLSMTAAQSGAVHAARDRIRAANSRYLRCP